MFAEFDQNIQFKKIILLRKVNFFGTVLGYKIIISKNLMKDGLKNSLEYFDSIKDYDENEFK